MKLPLIPQDKANHIVYGFIIYFICTFFTLSNDIVVNQLLNLLIVLLVAIGKELYSYFTIKTYPDIWDNYISSSISIN